MVMYDNNMIMSLKQKKRKFEPRIKLNHNIYLSLFLLPASFAFLILRVTVFTFARDFSRLHFGGEAPVESTFTNVK